MGQNSEDQQRSTYSEPRTGDGGDRSRGGEGIKGNGVYRRIFQTEKGRHIGGKRNAEASTFLRREIFTDDKAQCQSLIKWTKENGYFFTECLSILVTLPLTFVSKNKIEDIKEYG